MMQQQPHVDPDWEVKYRFCRVDCPECDRLDKLSGPVNAEQMGKIVTDLFAIDPAEEDRIPRPEV